MKHRKRIKNHNGLDSFASTQEREDNKVRLSKL
jgi:hypothetical protein